MVKTADRTLDVIELFAREQKPMNLSEIADQLGMPVSSAHGLLKTLQARGYLYELGRRQGYYPTKKLGLMATAITAAAPMLQTLAPFLADLRDQTDETVILAKRQGDAVTYLDVFESAQSVRLSPVIGEIKPLHASASGKAVLAAMPPAELAKTLARLPLPRYTESTLSERQAVLEQVEQGRKRGWQFVIGEHIPELMAIATPVHLGGDIYVVVVGGPIERFKPLVESHAARLKKTCAAIEKSAG